MVRLEDLQIDNLKIFQDDELYCFTSDAVLLSRFALVKKGDAVADFCSGSGIVGLNLYGLNKNLIDSVTLFEMQENLFNLSKKTVEYNNLQKVFNLENIKLQDIGENYKQAFSLIVCNPPYVKKGSGYSENIDTVSVCKSELTLNLAELVYAINFCLKPNGRVCIVHRADRIFEIALEFNKYKIEPKRIQFVGKPNKPPYLMLIEGVKGGKQGVKLLPTLEN